MAYDQLTQKAMELQTFANQNNLHQLEPLSRYLNRNKKAAIRHLVQTNDPSLVLADKVHSLVDDLARTCKTDREWDLAMDLIMPVFIR